VAITIVVVVVADVARAVVLAAEAAAAISNAKLNRRLRFTAQPFSFLERFRAP